jgi:3-hydroxyacyl-CoA dehydrogenase
MGAQIAAHLANTGVTVALFDLPAPDGDPNDIVNKAIKGLTRLRPSPLATRSALERMHPANYDQHLDVLGECDLVVEAISERIDWKHDLYQKISPFLRGDSIFASNTSGISIKKLAEPLPVEIQSRFCGVHFFNPPRYLHMVELIPHEGTDPGIMDALEGFLTTTMGKGVIRAKDTPGFVSNRVGSFALNAVFYHTQRLGLPFDLVDKLTGPGIGRAKSATYRTADVVGLDTVALVTEKSLAANLKEDPWHKFIVVPEWMRRLVEQGALGQKTGVGIYKKAGKEILVLDLATGGYRPVRDDVDHRIKGILGIRDLGEKFRAIKKCRSTQGEFLLSIFRDVFHYSAVHLPSIAHSARDVDFALRWGFGWELGPFEIWQAAGWRRTAKMLQRDIEAGRTMSDRTLPDWVLEPSRKGVHKPRGSWSPESRTYVPRSAHPVYKRQEFPEIVLGEKRKVAETVLETDEVRLWHTGDDLGVLNFKTKLNTISAGLIDGILQAIEVSEQRFKALILWQPTGPFCAGANLKELIQAAKAGMQGVIEDMVSRFQQANRFLRYSRIPTVAAVEGLAIGGGCEMMIHCDRVTAALETYAGMVEVGVGLIPAGGGTKEMTLRAVADAKGGDVFPHVARYYEQLAMGKVSTSAMEAREMGYLGPADLIVPHKHEILHVAKCQGALLYESGYRPPRPAEGIPVLGAAGRATLQARLANYLAGEFISEYDYLIARRLATVICGGEIASGQRVDEDWLLRLEREALLELMQQKKTEERILHMLEKGKPLRN